MNVIMEWFPKSIELIKVLKKYCWIFLVVTGVLLFLPNNSLERIGLLKFSQDFGMYIGIVFLFSVSIVLLNIISQIGKYIKSRFHQKKRLKILMENIFRLDPNEKSVLREFDIHKQNTITLPIDHPIVAGLLAKGIIIRVGNIGERSTAGFLFPVKISEYAKDILTPDLIDFPDKNELSEDDITYLKENRPEFISELEAHNKLFHNVLGRRHRY